MNAQSYSHHQFTSYHKQNFHHPLSLYLTSVLTSATDRLDPFRPPRCPTFFTIQPSRLSNTAFLIHIHTHFIARIPTHIHSLDVHQHTSSINYQLSLPKEKKTWTIKSTTQENSLRTSASLEHLHSCPQKIHTSLTPQSILD